MEVMRIQADEVIRATHRNKQRILAIENARKQREKERKDYEAWKAQQPKREGEEEEDSEEEEYPPGYPYE
jgi:hypothetical protein